MPGIADRPRRPDGLPEPASRFEAAVVDFLAGLLTAYPTWGTSVGYHSVDGLWPIPGEAGRQSRLGLISRHADILAAFEPSELGTDERVDQGLLADILAKLRFDEEVLREEAWDALALVYLMGSGLFGILAREYAPWEQRGGALLERVRGLPELARAGLAALTGLPDRPVSRLHLETALKQSSGIDELLDQAVAEAKGRAEQGEATELPAQLEAAAADARDALEELRRGLEGPVMARAQGEGRLGRGLYGAKLRHAICGEMDPHDLRSRALSEYTAVRAEMVRLAMRLWPHWLPGEPVPDLSGDDPEAEGTLVRRVLDTIAGDHPAPDELIGFCQAEIASIEAFCRDRDIIGLPQDPMRITWTPTFMRAYGRAFLDAPGPLDRGQSSQFWITPPDPADGAEAVESYLREENRRMLRVLCIHEGIPGHYLQLARSNECTSLVRGIFVDGMFAEGWAVYVTQVMMDAGFAGHDEALLLTHWKMYLRAAINALLDVETHAGEMSEEEALDLMVRGGFQEEDEARAKWLRARLTSTQLSTYFLGSQQMWDLETEVRRRAAVAAGAGPDAVPAPHVVGGLGSTPGFDQRGHLESVIAHGSPPIAWLSRMLLA